ncbi:hypothetical protein Tco_1343213 [Tanacetum coccineum]
MVELLPGLVDLLEGNAILVKWSDYLMASNNVYFIASFIPYSKRRAFWSLNEDILKITILKTNMPYPSRKIRRDLDNSTSNVLIPLDSWTSGLLVYKLPLSAEYGVSTSIGYGVSNFRSNTAYSFKLINTVYLLPLDTAYRSSGTEADSKISIIDFPAKFFLSFFGTNPTDCLSLVTEYSEEEEAKAMAETMEQYMSKTRTDYGSRVSRPKIDNKDQFEQKGQFLKELRENIFSSLDNEDANEHIEKVLEIVNLFHVPNITEDQLML